MPFEFEKSFSLSDGPYKGGLIELVSEDAYWVGVEPPEDIGELQDCLRFGFGTRFEILEVFDGLDGASLAVQGEREGFVRFDDVPARFFRNIPETKPPPSPWKRGTVRVANGFAKLGEVVVLISDKRAIEIVRAVGVSLAVRFQMAYEDLSCCREENRRKAAQYKLLSIEGTLSDGVYCAIQQIYTEKTYRILANFLFVPK